MNGEKEGRDMDREENRYDGRLKVNAYEEVVNDKDGQYEGKYGKINVKLLLPYMTTRWGKTVYITMISRAVKVNHNQKKVFVTWLGDQREVEATRIIVNGTPCDFLMWALV